MINIVKFVSIFSALLAPAVYAFPPRNSHRCFLVIVLYLVTCFSADVLSEFAHLNAAIVYNSQDVVQFCIVVWFYSALGGSSFLRSTISVLYLVTLLLTVVAQGVQTYHTYTWAFSSVMLAALGFSLMNSIYSDPKQYTNEKGLNGVLIANAAFVFYFLSVSSIFIITDIIFTHASKSIIYFTWATQNVLNIIKNIGLAIGIYVAARHSKNAL